MKWSLAACMLLTSTSVFGIKNDLEFLKPEGNLSSISTRKHNTGSEVFYNSNSDLRIRFVGVNSTNVRKIFGPSLLGIIGIDQQKETIVNLDFVIQKDVTFRDLLLFIEGGKHHTYLADSVTTHCKKMGEKYRCHASDRVHKLRGIHFPADTLTEDRYPSSISLYLFTDKGEMLSSVQVFASA